MVIPEEFKKDIDLAVEYLKTLTVTEIYLFGSVIKGNHSVMSDLDIAVRGIVPLNFFLAITELQGLLEHDFDLINLDFKDEFTENLEKSGEILRVS